MAISVRGTGGSSFAIKGLAELEHKLRAETAKPAIRRFLGRGAVVVQGEMRRLVRVDTGRGRNSIAYEVEGNLARIGTNLAYLEVMARGRAPGRKQPPPGSLLPWMRRHGMDPKAEFLIARKIGRKGIKGDDFDVRAVEAATPKIEAHVPVFARDLEDTLRRG